MDPKKTYYKIINKRWWDKLDDIPSLYVIDHLTAPIIMLPVNLTITISGGELDAIISCQKVLHPLYIKLGLIQVTCLVV